MHNRMYQQNKERIVTSFFYLLTEKNYQQITIVDIVNNAGISRRTFYRIFPDKQSILDNYLDEWMKNWINYVSNNRPTSQQKMVKQLFKFWEPFIPELTILVNANLASLILEKYNEIFPKYFIDFHNGTQDNEELALVKLRYLSYFDIGAIWNVFINWIKDPYKISLEDLTSLIQQQF
ncbi:hypothetical protein C5O77_09865 [Limosilactobacillus reuteri]|uniref:HTH tetR-type domain-containing protein n=1 Tax=Limosilactobacillus reuteri TaxID=1598 RepID=A0A3M6SAN8_LIMRT|nr:TetR/AcrR family transcriptional regulator [Limosilactobacillus reuteri]RMX24446.1 hypothetical protein C5O77_09865 [Limosilactobacillus reuteri]